MTDNDILRLMRDDPPRGQRALFDKYYSYVYAIVSRLISGFGSSSDMEECAADVFAAVMMKLMPRDDTALKSYIGTAARNAAISMRRRLAAKTGLDCREGDEELSALADTEDIADNAEKSERSELLLRMIEELGTPDSVILIQKYYYDRSSKEIAEMVGMNAAAVRVRCARAMKRLKKLLDENDITL
ncbi:RNA polymerase sigma factor [Ruminococcus flavefaciens]|uniref:RNA polymerase sigma factor n=1 Tax=Ruminococcus flavefaciens TaxID=1265 RepID=UPI00048A4CFF|nr:sigma-70 family RNA polymerase sigma factor [Ruminococcus flavefaciens]